jgi:hypothetical protein
VAQDARRDGVAAATWRAHGSHQLHVDQLSERVVSTVIPAGTCVTRSNSKLLGTSRCNQQRTAALVYCTVHAGRRLACFATISALHVLLHSACRAKHCVLAPISKLRSVVKLTSHHGQGTGVAAPQVAARHTLPVQAC